MGVVAPGEKKFILYIYATRKFTAFLRVSAKSVFLFFTIVVYFMILSFSVQTLCVFFMNHVLKFKYTHKQVETLMKLSESNFLVNVPRFPKATFFRRIPGFGRLSCWYEKNLGPDRHGALME